MTGINQENDGKKYLRVGQSKHPIITTYVRLYIGSFTSKGAFEMLFRVCMSKLKQYGRKLRSQRVKLRRYKIHIVLFPENLAFLISISSLRF